jgi:protein-tyrosine phosphatase
MNEQARRVAFDGAANFRDIGGYPAGPGRRVRWNRIFRSDNLSGLTEADLEWFASLGIQTIIDFRVPFERDRQPNRLPDGSAIAVRELGFVPLGGIEMLRGIAAGTLGADDVKRMVVAQYRSFVTDCDDYYREALKDVLDETRLPLLIHCTSGKDRTGFAIAILLAAVGTPRETIVRDFVLTNEYRRDLSLLFTNSTLPGVADMLTSAQSEYIEAAFEQIDETYGNVETYLEKALGIDAAARQRLIDLLTEPVP